MALSKREILRNRTHFKREWRDPVNRLLQQVTMRHEITSFGSLTMQQINPDSRRCASACIAKLPPAAFGQQKLEPEPNFGVENHRARLHECGRKQPSNHGIKLSIFKGTDFAERRKAAAEAAAAKLEKFKAKPAADDPAVLAREAERKAVAEARVLREAEKARVRAEKLAQETADKAARAVEQAARREADAAAKLADEAAAKSKQHEMAARVMVDEADRKAKRDARYAARKAAKK